MIVDYLVIGQGISGTFLSYYLRQEGKSVLVVDNNQSNSPSRIAAGIINPVTGRRMVTVWMAGELLPFATKAYSEIGHALGITPLSSKSVIDFFPNPFMRESFIKRIAENDGYVHAFPEQNQFNQHFQYEFGCGEIRPAYLVHLEILLPAWRQQLLKDNQLLEDDFDVKELIVHADHVNYKDITATAIIFCDGAAGFENPYFSLLPFAPNKGEALLVEIPGLPAHSIYKKNMTLAPMAEQDLFWIGSVYQWTFDHTDPTPDFLENATQVLKNWIKLPFRIRDHVAGVRPATLERRPFVGVHPQFRNIGILNGMGTKGCSLAPYFARQLTDHLLYAMDITAEADVQRFSRILTRK